MENAPAISVIGLGKIGICVCAALSHRGIRVVGLDIDPGRVRALKCGDPETDEEGLNDVLAQNQDRLRGTLDYDTAIGSTTMSYVIVPTPSEENGAYHLGFVTRAFCEIGKSLRSKDAYHLIVLASTVLPGSIRSVLIPQLESASGKVCGRDFGLCYSPPFVALGDVLRNFLNPEFILIGEFDTHSGNRLSDCFGAVMGEGIPCKRMAIENAEVTKLAVNTFVTMKIVFANMLADICESIPNGDIDVVSDAVGTDKRIGCHSLRGGLGYGGPCFPRDNAALGCFARQLGLSVRLSEATDQENRGRPAAILSRLPIASFRGLTIAVLGLGYKRGSSVIVESQSISLAQLIRARGAFVRAFDFDVDHAAVQLLSGCMISETLEECLRDADVVFVLTPHPGFQGIVSMLAAHTQRSVTVVDAWRTVSPPDEPGGLIRYLALGRYSTEHSTCTA